MRTSVSTAGVTLALVSLVVATDLRAQAPAGQVPAQGVSPMAPPPSPPMPPQQPQPPQPGMPRSLPTVPQVPQAPNQGLAPLPPLPGAPGIATPPGAVPGPGAGPVGASGEPPGGSGPAGVLSTVGSAIGAALTPQPRPRPPGSDVIRVDYRKWLVDCLERRSRCDTSKLTAGDRDYLRYEQRGQTFSPQVVQEVANSRMAQFEPGPTVFVPSTDQGYSWNPARSTRDPEGRREPSRRYRYTTSVDE